jgi:hypothetical protein
MQRVVGRAWSCKGFISLDFLVRGGTGYFLRHLGVLGAVARTLRGLVGFCSNPYRETLVPEQRRPKTAFVILMGTGHQEGIPPYL